MISSVKSIPFFMLESKDWESTNLQKDLLAIIRTVHFLTLQEGLYKKLLSYTHCVLFCVKVPLWRGHRGHVCNLSTQRLEGRGRRITRTSRPVWSTFQVPGSRHWEKSLLGREFTTQERDWVWISDIRVKHQARQAYVLGSRDKRRPGVYWLASPASW